MGGYRKAGVFRGTPVSRLAKNRTGNQCHPEQADVSGILVTHRAPGSGHVDP